VPAPSQATYSPQAQQPAQYGLRVVDSLTANEFRLEINGQVVSGVFSVHGLCAFSLKVDEAGKPVGINYPPLVITKMVQQDPSLPFNAWVREAVQARGTVLPTREIAIVALDEGAETRRWVYRNAWIAEVNFSDFDTASEYLVEEKITLRHNGVEEIWPQR
jgi:phage tail-like protein